MMFFTAENQPCSLINKIIQQVSHIYYRLPDVVLDGKDTPVYTFPEHTVLKEQGRQNEETNQIHEIMSKLKRRVVSFIEGSRGWVRGPKGDPGLL